jgi:fluoride ion exporter CrcB/FEX
LDFAMLWERGAMAPAAAYLLVSVGGSLAAIFVALAIARAAWA